MASETASDFLSSRSVRRMLGIAKGSVHAAMAAYGFTPHGTLRRVGRAGRPVSLWRTEDVLAARRERQARGKRRGRYYTRQVEGRILAGITRRALLAREREQ